MSRWNMRKVALTVLVFVWGLLIPTVFAQEEGDDKTLSPYFLVKSENPEADQLPLKSTRADVKVAGVIADVLVTQVYKNEGKNPIEAIYVFPASTRAAVYGMKMTIADRTIVATIQKKEEARRQYEEAKRQGKSASLLEQERPNVFTMNVANILPGDEIKVEMNYTELLVPTDGVYDFVFPTVVGPRYSNQKADAPAPKKETWVANPYLGEGEKSATTFHISVALTAGLPIQEITCDTHKTKISYDGPAKARCDLDESEKHGGNRDFIFKYRLTGGQVESGLLLHQGDKENFFLLMVQPPKTVAAEDVPARDFVFVVDVSGSMHGFPLDTAKELMKNLLKSLRSKDTFNVLLFSGGSRVLGEESLPATDENIELAFRAIDREHGGGGTELLPALKRALELKKPQNLSRTFVVVTDGYVTVENEAFDLIRNNLNKANLFAFGIGSSINRFIIEGMARAGMGEPLIITGPAEAAAKAERFRKYIETPVLTSVQVDFGDFQVKGVEPRTVPDVLAERPVIVFGKWIGDLKGEIKLSGFSGKGEYKQSFDVSKSQPLPENSALRYLWARHRIAVLSDYNQQRNDPEIVEEVTSLGLNYNLLTNYTSFVAVDSLARLKPGETATTVQQPLPLPQGVSNYALGGAPAPTMSKSLAADSFSEVDSEEMVSGSFDRAKVKREVAQQIVPKAPRGYPEPLVEKIPGQVKLDGIIASGGLKSNEIRAAIEAGMKPIYLAFAEFLKTHPKAKGRIGLEFEIDATGKVVKILIATDDLGDKDFAKKVTEAFEQIAFPAAKKATEGTIHFSFAP